MSLLTHIGRIRESAFSPYVRTYFPYVILIANVAALTILILNKIGDFPIGWDAPYYISRVRYFEELGVLSNRTGFITLMSTIHTALNIPLVTLHTLFTIFSISLLSILSAMLASHLIQPRRMTFVLTFISVSWYTSYFALSVSTYDNALGIIFMLSALVFLTCVSRGWKGATLFALAAVMTLLTHLESYLLLVCILFVYSVFEYFRLSTFTKWIQVNKPYVVVLVLTLLFAGIQWADVIAPIFSQYASPSLQGVNASTPYSQTRSLAEFFKLLTTGIPSTVYAVLFVVGVYGVYTRRKQDNPRLSNILLAYLVAAYGLLLYSVLRSSIPINRTVLLLPVPLFIGIGVAQITTFFSKHSATRVSPTLASIVFLIVLPSMAYQVYVQRFPVSISPDVYTDLTSLNAHVLRNDVSHFILVTNTDSQTQAASAYYGLWSNWIQSIFPLEDGTRASCLYFGKVENLPRRVPTVRAENTEYNATNIESLSCISKLPENSKIYLAKSLYSGNPPVSTSSVRVTEITSTLFEIEYLVYPISL